MFRYVLPLALLTACSDGSIPAADESVPQTETLQQYSVAIVVSESPINVGDDHSPSLVAAQESDNGTLSPLPNIDGWSWTPGVREELKLLVRASSTNIEYILQEARQLNTLTQAPTSAQIDFKAVSRSPRYPGLLFSGEDGTTVLDFGSDAALNNAIERAVHGASTIELVPSGFHPTLKRPMFSVVGASPLVSPIPVPDVTRELEKAVQSKPNQLAVDFPAYALSQNVYERENLACGTTALSMVLNYWNKQPRLYTRFVIDKEIRRNNWQGMTPKGLIDYVKTSVPGMRADFINRITNDQLVLAVESGWPVLLLIDSSPDNSKDSALHWVVAFGVVRDAAGQISAYRVLDPFQGGYRKHCPGGDPYVGGETQYTPEQLRKRWDNVKAIGVSIGVRRGGIIVRPQSTPTGLDIAMLPKPAKLPFLPNLLEAAFSLVNGLGKPLEALTPAQACERAPKDG